MVIGHLGGVHGVHRGRDVRACRCTGLEEVGWGAWVCCSCSWCRGSALGQMGRGGSTPGRRWGRWKLPDWRSAGCKDRAKRRPSCLAGAGLSALLLSMQLYSWSPATVSHPWLHVPTHMCTHRYTHGYMDTCTKPHAHKYRHRHTAAHPSAHMGTQTHTAKHGDTLLGGDTLHAPK